jgi:hypothetical protein
MVAGGAQPPWMTYSVAAIVFAGALISGAQSLLRRRRNQRAATYYAPVRQNAATSEDDLKTIKQVDELLRWHAIPWIAAEEFVASWRDDRIAPFREVLRLVDGRTPTSDVHLDIELEKLGDATRSFLTVYEAVTVIDPLFRDDAWRLVREDELAPNGIVADGSAEAVKLRTGAVRIVDAYMQLQGTLESLRGHG